MIYPTDLSQNAGEQAVILDKMYKQMQEFKTETQRIEAENLEDTNPPSQSDIGNFPVKVLKTS